MQMGVKAVFESTERSVNDGFGTLEIIPDATPIVLIEPFH